MILNVILKKTIKATLATRPFWALGRALQRPGVVVLMYHRVATADEPLYHLDVDVFRRQMEWLSRHCDLIAPAELQERCLRPKTSRRAVLVTFDDGYRSYVDHAYPILKRMGIPALLFLSTSTVDSPSSMLWFDRVQLSVHHAPPQRIVAPWNADLLYDLGDPAGKRAFSRRFKDYVKEVPDSDRLAYVEAVIGLLGVGDIQRVLPRQMLTWDEVRTASDITEWGGHTHTHPILARLADEAIEEEVRLSRTRIAEETGTRSQFFAYPNGRTQDFDSRCRTALLRHDYDVAFSVEPGLNGPDTDWLAVRRLTGDGTVGQLGWQVAGFSVRGLGRYASRGGRDNPRETGLRRA